jgi:hypothetical protein
MGIATTAAIIGGVGSVAGAIGGAMGSKKTTTTDEKSSTTGGLRLGAASAQEQAATGTVSTNFSQLQDFANLGPGASDVTAGTGASRDLASLLQQYQQSGGAPSSQDIEQGQSFAGRMFAAQRLGAQQASMEAQQQFAQQAAIQGRGGLDPIFRNKVAQEQQRAEAMIGAQQNAFASQQAQQFSDRRLDFAGKRAQVLGGLATQALSNRQALVGMGSQIQAAERNFRLATAEKYGTSAGNKTSVEETPGSVMGAISGGLGGLSAGIGAVGGLGKMFNPSGTTGGIGGSLFGGNASQLSAVQNFGKSDKEEA